MTPDHVSCDRCEAVYPRFCDRCAYLMNNMRRWRKVAEQLHGETCKHPERQKLTSCSAVLETIYNSIRIQDIGAV